ncbi:MAG: class I SAM-dependent methyltransferase [Thermodesulfobacteriota bacterium]|nr:class I SAM-dependent methyltransferase [Thermodesulfobacteriota bacterium]
MKWKYLTTLLRTVRIPGLFPIVRDWEACLRMHFVYAALESGLLEALSTPSSRDALIQKLNVRRQEILDALLDVGLAVKELAYRDGMYRIKGKRSKAITGSQGDMLAAMIQANVTYYSAAYRNAADRMRGAPLGNDLEKMGSLVARFSKIGEPFIRDFMTTIVSEKESIRVLDVGCGSGVFLQSVYSANGNARGIGIDIDEQVVDQARQNMEKWGLRDRFSIVAGDILDPPRDLEGPFDFITLYNVMYYFTAEKRPALIDRLRSMLPLNGILAVAMHFQSKGKDLGAANLNMVNCSLEGLTHLPDLNGLTAQLEKSGFNGIKTQRLIPGSTFYGVVAAKA